jgi:type II secretory pathway component PulK
MNHNQQGSTLIIVIWFIAIIGVIVTFIFFRTEVEWAAVVNFENMQRYAEEAQIVLHERCSISSKSQEGSESSEKLGLLGLLVNDKTTNDTINDPWYCHGRVDLEQDGFKITVIIEDEGSKPNLNTVSDKGLQQLWQLAASGSSSQTTPSPTGTSDMQQPTPSPMNPRALQSPTPSSSPISTDSPQNASIAIEPVLDWRDIDDSVQRAEGAKLSYYQSLNPPYKIRNGCFSSLEEIKLVKNGDKLYPLLAPEVTVFGLVNPNTIEGRTFTRLLCSYGDFLSKSLLETATAQFDEYRASKKRFTKMDDLGQLGTIFSGTLDKIKPLFQFTGRCNVNLATKNNLLVTLNESGYNANFATTFISRQKDAPFENSIDINNFLGYNENQQPQDKKRPDDFFTTTSTIIHYKLWVTKGLSTYYLDTVWERQMVGIKKEWQINPLSWRVLLNDAAPEIPKVEDTETNNDDSKKTIKKN